MIGINYFLLQTLSDEPIILSKKQIEDILSSSVDPETFLVQKETNLVDMVTEERPSNYVLNFTPLVSLGIVKRSFLAEFISFEEASRYLDFSNLFYKKNNQIEETDFLFYKCKNVIYTRSTKASIFKTSELSKQIIYVPDGREYITHVPSTAIPIYGTQLGGQLIVREDLLKPILGRKYRKLHIAKLEVKTAIDGFEFIDSMAL